MPRALLVGCAAVAALYLAVNWVLVANLNPSDFKVVFGYDESRVTLGHVILTRLLGRTGGIVMSVLVLVAFISAASAMTVVGPRVYSAMADDGFLPKVLRASTGEVPVRSVLLQCAVALVILATHTLQETLANLGAILTLFAALVSLAVLIRATSQDAHLPKPDPLTMVAASIHVASSVFMLYFGFRHSPRLLLWVAIVAVFGLTFWATAARRLQRAALARAD